MKLEMIYVALLATKVEKIILTKGFKSVLSLANSMAKGVKRNKKGLIFKAIYKALKNLDMDISNSKWIEVKSSEVKSRITENLVYTLYEIVRGLVMRYDQNEIAILSEKYNFNVLLVGD